MANFPTEDLVDGQTFTTANNVTYVYVLASNKWKIQSQELILDSVSSTSTTRAAAANSVKTAYDLANSVQPLGTTLNTDGTYKGVTIQLPIGETIAFSDVVYFGTGAKLWKTDADAAVMMPAIGITVIGGDADGTGTILTHGQICETSWNWGTVGGTLYVDNASTGALTLTAPSGIGDIIQVFGIVLSADTVFVNPSLMTAEVV